MENGKWKMENFGVAFGDDFDKKALQRNATQNFSPFIIHHSPDAQKERRCRSF
jgi:hypothetical protein